MKGERTNMRNVDRIKELEREIGRREKKILDQARELEAAGKELEEFRAGSLEVQRLVDALLVVVAMDAGDQAGDQDSGERIGWRMTIPGFDVEEINARYEVHARREGEFYVVGVTEREETPIGVAPSSVSPSGCHLPPEGKA